MCLALKKRNLCNFESIKMIALSFSAISLCSFFIAFYVPRLQACKFRFMSSEKYYHRTYKLPIYWMHLFVNLHPIHAKVFGKTCRLTLKHCDVHICRRAKYCHIKTLLCVFQRTSSFSEGTPENFFVLRKVV